MNEATQKQKAEWFNAGFYRGAFCAFLVCVVVLVFCLGGCSYRNPRPIACGPGKASASVTTWRHTSVNGEWRKLSTFTITNPTTDDVMLDCNRERTRVNGCREADVLAGEGCDLQNDITYSPNSN